MSLFKVQFEGIGDGYPPVTIEGRSCVVGRLSCLRLDDMAEFYSEEDFSEGVAYELRC